LGQGRLNIQNHFFGELFDSAFLGVHDGSLRAEADDAAGGVLLAITYFLYAIVENRYEMIGVRIMEGLLAVFLINGLIILAIGLLLKTRVFSFNWVNARRSAAPQISTGEKKYVTKLCLS
jgi:predicted membrane-bound dolichyl-phosphate-mannose-protein mannosyltransferase